MIITKNIQAFCFYLLFALFLLTIGCGSDSQKPDQAEQTKMGQPEIIEGDNVPRDAFHGYAPGKSSPQDPDFHKGTAYLENSQIGLKPEKTAQKRPTTPDEIITFYSNILIDNPKDHKAWIMVGGAYSLKGEHFEAVKKYNQSLVIKETAEAFSNMAFAYSDMGELDEALEQHENALLINPDFINSYYGLAMVYEKKGDVKNAFVNWEKYIAKSDKKSRFIKIAQSRVEKIKALLKKQ